MWVMMPSAAATTSGGLPLRPEVRPLFPLPDDDLRPGAMEVQGEKGELVHGQHHPVLHLPHGNGGA